MKPISFLTLFAIGALGGSMLLAQDTTSPQGRPANATGICRDGTYTTDAGRSIACKKHHGVKEWFTPSPAPTTPPAAENTPATPPASSRQPDVPQAAPSKTTQARTQSLAAAKAAGDAAAAENAPLPTRSIASASQQNESAEPPATSGRHGARKTPAPGGGPGLVWLNTASNVYHCPGTAYYGTTRKGSYMSEADAKAKGARIAHGESCGQ